MPSKGEHHLLVSVFITKRGYQVTTFLSSNSDHISSLIELLSFEEVSLFELDALSHGI